MKKLVGAILIILAFQLLAGICPAEEKTKKEKKASPKELYKKNCKVCHAKGSEHKEYTPMSLIVMQWERFFDKKFVPTHEKVKAVGSEKTVTETITPDVLKVLRKFCVDHAADSEKPMTCG